MASSSCEFAVENYLPAYLRSRIIPAAFRAPITKKTESWKDVQVEFGLCGTAEVSSEDDEVEAMDVNKWKDLPEELLMPILAGLPLQTIFRLRSVCKKWNTLLHSASFFEMCSQVRTQAPFFVRQTDHGYAAYISESNSWHFWPNLFISSHYSLPTSSTSPVPYQESGTAGGLVLLDGCGKYGKNGYPERILHLANPMNKTHKPLPLVVPALLDRSASTIVGMVVDKNSGSYKILAVVYGYSSDDQPFKSYLYDSKCNSWDRIGGWQRREVGYYFGRPALYNESLYCLTSDANPCEYHSHIPPMYKVFCVGRGSWHELPAPMPSPLTFAHLFEMRGRLMLAGGRTNQKGLLSVHIWQLDEVDKVDKEWVEVMTMPDHLVQALSFPMDSLTVRFTCVTVRDYICVTSASLCPDICNTVMCHSSTNFWWLLPPYWKRSYSTAFLFEPRLDVIL